MKIGILALPQVNLGKHNIKDSRLDDVDKLVKAKKKTYIQIETVGEDALLDADAIITAVDNKTDLILRDLEFVETRLGRSVDEADKALLNKLKIALEKEELICNLGLAPAEKEALVKYGLLTVKPIILAAKEELEDINALLARAVKEGGYISFFTSGEKDTRAWLIKNGATAWEASGAVHSDIQQGFIRAEIISLEDFLTCGGETQSKQAGKQRLEQKDYIMKDCDLTNFRFNK
ncbi:MAG: DUF933 domain-containing protein [Candidatus Omnitrophota bacterium]